MKIALFSDTYKVQTNGVSVSVELLEEGLKKRGHDVYIITTNNKLKTEIEGNVIKLPALLIKDYFGYTITSPFHINAIKKIKELNLDIIHVHTEFGIGIFGRLVSKILKIPLIYTYHTMFEDYSHYINFLRIKLFDNFSKKIAIFISKIYCNYVNEVIVPSNKTFKVLKNYNIKTKMNIIPTAIDLDKFKNIDVDESLKIKKSLSIDNKKTFIYVGRIAKEKNLEIVLKAFTKLKEIYILIVGTGPELENLKSKYNYDNIKFIGEINYKDVPKYYSIADAFISASISETQGLTFIEAMANGKILFCKDKEVLDGLLINGENGYFFENENDLIEKINLFYENNIEKINLMSEKSIKVSKNYEIDTFISNIEEVYKNNLDKIYKIKSIKIKNDRIRIKISNKLKKYIISKEIFEKLELKEFQMIDLRTFNYIKNNSINT